MNLSGFIDEDNATFELFEVNETKHHRHHHHHHQQQQQQQADEFTDVITLYRVFEYVSLALGIPGNVLSAIVWLRLYIANKTSSIVYLAVLAINDIVFLLFERIYSSYETDCVDWLCYCSQFLFLTATTLEPLLVLGFSVERLIAICCPLQVRLNISLCIQKKHT